MVVTSSVAVSVANERLATLIMTPARVFSPRLRGLVGGNHKRKLGDLPSWVPSVEGVPGELDPSSAPGGISREGLVSP